MGTLECAMEVRDRILDGSYVAKIMETVLLAETSTLPWLDPRRPEEPSDDSRWNIQSLSVRPDSFDA